SNEPGWKSRGLAAVSSEPRRCDVRGHVLRLQSQSRPLLRAKRVESRSLRARRTARGAASLRKPQRGGGRAKKAAWARFHLDFFCSCLSKWTANSPNRRPSFRSLLCDRDQWEIGMRLRQTDLNDAIRLLGQSGRDHSAFSFSSEGEEQI